jgi:hypothetical protein
LFTINTALLHTEEDSDDIINAASSKGIYDMTLGLSDKERRELGTNQASNANAIVFGEAKEGAIEGTISCQVHQSQLNTPKTRRIENQLQPQKHSHSPSLALRQGLPR